MDWQTIFEHSFINFLFSIGFIMAASIVWLLTAKDDDDDDDINI